MAIPQISEQQIKQAADTHSKLVGNQMMNDQMSALYRKQTLSPSDANKKVALQSALQAYQAPSESEMQNHASVVSTAAGRKALGINGQWPMSQTPYSTDGSSADGSDN